MPYIHNLDPIAFSIGPLAIRWYGLMYLIGFLLFLALGKLRARDQWRDMSSQDVDDLLFYGMIGVIVGGRLGHVLFYGPLSHYLANPLEIFAVWKGGMASHGGIIGVIVAMAMFARACAASRFCASPTLSCHWCLWVSARAALATSSMVSCGVGWRPSLPWSVVFPQAGDALPRHPSQIYQFLLEGVDAVCDSVDLFAQAARRRHGRQPVSDFLWPAAHRRRSVSRARGVVRSHAARHVGRAMVVGSDGRDRSSCAS